MVARPMQRDEMARMVDAHRYPLHPNRYRVIVYNDRERGLT